MTINLSAETIVTATSALRCSKASLTSRLRRDNLSDNDREITEHQLEDVNNALHVFEELEDSCISMKIEV